MDVQYLVGPDVVATNSCPVTPHPSLDSSDVRALKQFQAKWKVGDSDETSAGMVKPDSDLRSGDSFGHQ